MIARLQVSRMLEKKSESAGFWKKMKVGGFWEKWKNGRVLDFTGGFGLKVRQVSAGFGCGEGYKRRNSQKYS